MPKDATKNIDRYKIKGGQLNEFDFHQNQEEFAEQQRARATNLIPGTPPEEKGEGLRPKVANTETTAKKRAAKTKKRNVATKSTKGTKTRKGAKTSKGTKTTKASTTAKKK